MIETGKIVIGIDRKIYFEYYKLEKPTKEMFICYSIWIQKKAYNRALKEYEASKQLIEVENVFWNFEKKEWICLLIWRIIRNNQKCKAEVNGKATIVELIK